MATNYLQDGTTLDYLNKGKATVAAGSALAVGDLTGVAHDDILPGMTGVLHTRGVFILPKAAEAITQGQTLYLSDGKLTAKAGGGVAAGIAWGSALAPEASVAIRLAE